MKLLRLLLLAMVLHLVPAAKILILPFDHKGHVNSFKVAGKELQNRGHDVVILAQPRNKHLVENSGIPFIINHGKELNPTEDDEKLGSSLFDSGFRQMVKLVKIAAELAETALNICNEVMKNDEMMSSLKEHNFDVVLVDGAEFSRCLYVIPYKLDVPYITLAVRNDPWAAGLPAMPSVEGMFGMFIMKKDTGYTKTVMNLALYTVMYFMSPPPTFKNSQIQDMAPEKPQTTYDRLFKNSAVFLLNGDNTCMDYPKIEGPHYHFIGGMAASPPKPLPEEFASFVAKAQDGLIVVSFGSLIKKAPLEMMRKMMETFGQIKQFVVMRYDGKLDNVPENVMLAKWLPQNDLLGHPKTRLFIAHGGNNGQMEALYHGTPMIVMPFMGDQLYSATRIEDKKFGKCVNPMDFSSHELLDAINEVLSNPLYDQNMKKCSAVSKSFPSAHEQIHFWVEHIVKFGGDHLKPISLDMPLYRVFMLDVMCILLIIDIVCCYAAYRCCKCTYRRCRSHSKTKTE